MKKTLAYAGLVTIRTSIFFCIINLYCIWATQTVIKLPVTLPVDLPLLTSFL